VTRRAVEEILFEMKNLRDGGVTDDELTMVKNYIVGSFPLSLETPQQMAGRLASIPLFELGADYYDTYIETVRSLTKEDINRAAATYLKPETVLLTVSGNTDVLPTELAGLGEITLYDNNFRKA
jgi:predicted Zn-dependent peptidase